MGKSIVEILREYSGKCGDALVSARIDHACYIIKLMSDEQINEVKSLKEFLLKIEKPHSRLDDPVAELEEVINDLEKIDVTSGDKYKAQAVENEIKKFENGRKKRRVVSILFLVLLGVGITITVIFAFLDNFHVIDYGGTAAGASGIIDLGIGVAAFIVERISDIKSTNGMIAAQQVHDAESYGIYIVNSFHHIKVVDKRKCTQK